MNLDLLLETLRQHLPDESLELETLPVDDVFITLSPEGVRAAVRLLVEQFGVRHLSTITGQDTGEQVELLYHFWDGQGLTLRTGLPSSHPRIDTVTDLVPGAAFYEREVNEMLGVAFDGLDDLGPLLLPDDWDGGPPLRGPGGSEVKEDREEGA